MQSSLVCRSIQVLKSLDDRDSTVNPRIFTTSCFLSLPIAKNVCIRLQSQSRPTVVVIGQVNGCEVGVVTSETIVLNQRQSQTRLDVKKQEDKDNRSCCGTHAVTELMRRLVLPVCVLWSQCESRSRLLKGILLVGPPGGLTREYRRYLIAVDQVSDVISSL